MFKLMRSRPTYCKSCVLMCLLTLAVVAFIRKNRSNIMVFQAAKDPNPTNQQLQIKEEAALVSDEIKVEADMASRRQVMEDMCSKHVGDIPNKKSTTGYYVKPYNFYVCLVAKVASTFWSRFLYQLHHTAPVGSPFDINVSTAYAGLNTINARHYTDLNMNNINTKLMFVREPYGRLFSAYVDKLVPPNPFYWKTWGQRAIMEFRPIHESAQFVYGNDTTFSEFISFATTRGHRIDVHLTPIYKVCGPCKTKFTTIGKMESFEQDAKYVISRLGIPEKQIGFDRMKAHQVEDALVDSTGGTFSLQWLRSTLRCITLETAAQRVWRKLQIRGFISWRQRLQLTPYQKEHLDMKQIVTLLREAEKASTNQTELKIQKRQAFLEAFSTLSTAQIQDIKCVYGPDFQLYEYDIDLVDKLLKGRADMKNTHSLDYSNDWDLSSIMGSL